SPVFLLQNFTGKGPQRLTSGSIESTRLTLQFEKPPKLPEDIAATKLPPQNGERTTIWERCFQILISDISTECWSGRCCPGAPDRRGASWAITITSTARSS